MGYRESLAKVDRLLNESDLTKIDVHQVGRICQEAGLTILDRVLVWKVIRICRDQMRRKQQGWTK